MALKLSKELVIECSRSLPAFPRVVNEILETLEDDNATLNTLTDLVETDPVITARILSVANSAAAGGRNAGQLRNVQSAISLIGLTRVKHIAVAVSLAEFTRQNGLSTYYWEHSVAVAVTAQELARIAHVSADLALVTGLLHDLGQLWMARVHPEEFQLVHKMHEAGRHDIIPIERHYFGTDHCVIGAILAAHWGLPAPVVAALRYHHDPRPMFEEASALDNKLVPLIHVAEVLANALDLTDRQDNRVTWLSGEACAAIGLNLEEDLSYLFGKIEVRAENACRSFR